jgi:hypothetical protein
LYRTSGTSKTSSASGALCLCQFRTKIYKDKDQAKSIGDIQAKGRVRLHNELAATGSEVSMRLRGDHVGFALDAGGQVEGLADDFG